MSIPAPHMHHYNAEYDAMERRLLAQWNWMGFPLQDGDDDA